MSQVKLFDPFTRKPGTTLQHFSRHWTEIHAEIAKTIPQIKHYVQSHRRNEPLPTVLEDLAPSRVDGSSETWYDDPDAIVGMVDEPGVQALLVDEENFMDLSWPRYPVMTRENMIDGEVQAPSADGVKLLVFTRRAPHLDADAFLDAWVTGDDQDLGRAVGATRHVVCPRVEDFAFPNAEVPQGTDTQIDGVRELWWPSVEAMTDGASSDPTAWTRLVTPSAVDPSRSFPLFAYERLIIA
jgi:EthD domain